MDERLKLLSRAITELVWDYDAERRLTRLGLTKPYCERVVRRCVDARVDLKTLSSGSMTVFYYDQGVTIEVVFVNPRRPVIAGVYKDPTPRTPSGSKKAKSTKKGATYPKSFSHLKDRIRALGYDISADSHPKVTKNGRLVVTLPGSPGDYRALKNAWSDFKIADKKERGSY